MIKCVSLIVFSKFSFDFYPLIDGCELIEVLEYYFLIGVVDVGGKPCFY